MTDYNLGTAHGKVEIDYDGTKVRQAPKDLDAVGKKAAENSKKVETANAEMQGTYDALRSAITKLSSEVDKHAATEVVAKSRVEAAEKALAAVRANTASTAKQVKEAERQVSQAQAKSVQASQRLGVATEALAGARRKLNSIPLKTPEVDQNTTRSFLNLSQAIRNIEAHTKKSASGLNTFTGRTKLLIGAIAVATPGVAGLGVSLAALTGIAGVAAGALAAAGAAAATLAIGTAGISDVFKAAAADSKAAGGAAASSAKQQKAAARAIEDAKRGLIEAEENLKRTREDAARSAIQAERAIVSAQRDLVSAQRDALRAQESLTKARRDATRQLEDMRLALVGGALDERQALLDVQEAQEDLNKVLKDPTTTSREREQALLNLQKQQHALEETRLANQRLASDQAEAAAKGVAGSDQVVSAQDAVRDAMQGIRDAQQGVADAQEAAKQQQLDSARAISDAVQGVADAQRSLEDAYDSAAEAGASGASKTADAMAKISPNARALVSEVLSLKDEWQDLKFAVQDRLFAGLADDVKPLASIYFPLLKEGLGGIADGFNGIVKDVVEFLKTSEATDNIRQIFDNTGTAVKNLRTFVTDLLAAFLDIAAVGSDFLPDMATNASNAASSFRQFVSEARESGKLRQWMQDAMDTVSDLWQLLKNLASIIGTVFSAFDQEGGGALNTLTALTGKVAEFLKSAEGQEALHALGRILASIGGAYGKVFLSFLDVAAGLLVSLEPLITAFADAAGTYLAVALQALAVVLQPLADLLGFIGPALGPIVAGMYAANKAVDAAKLAWSGLNTIMSANPFLIIAAAVVALAYLIITNWDAIKAGLAAAWQWISDLATTVWTAISDFFSGIWTGITDEVKAIWTIITNYLSDRWKSITSTVTKVWNGIKDFFSTIGRNIADGIKKTFNSLLETVKAVPGKVIDFLKSLPGKLADWAGDLIQGVVDGLGNMASAIWDKLKSIVSGAWDSVLDFFGINSPAREGIWAGEMIGKGLANGIENSISEVKRAATNLSNATAVALPGFDVGTPSNMAFNAAQGNAPVGLSLPNVAATAAAAAGTESKVTNIYVDKVENNIKGNLDPTNPVAWRKAMVGIKDGIRNVERDYAK